MKLFFLVRSLKNSRNSLMLELLESQIGAVFEIGGEAGGDGGVVHLVMKRLRFHGHHPQLLRLLLREATRSEPGSGSRKIRFHLQLLRLDPLLLVAAVSGINVIRLR